MSGRKRSGAQCRKRRKEAEIASKKSSILLAGFLKKAKKEAEPANSSSSESENGSYQPPVSEHVDANVEIIEDSEKNTTLTDIPIHAEKSSKITEDQVQEVQHNDELVEDETEKLSDSEATSKTTHYDVVPAVLTFHDVGYLEFDEITKLPKISQSLRDEMITLGSSPFQHTDNLSSVYGERSITSAWFKRRLANGEEVNRSWLLYSPVNNAAYCFCCLLFTSSTSNSRASFELKNGFNKWRKPEKLKAHENNPCHRIAFTTWKETERRLVSGSGIDSIAQAQIHLEKQRWRDILQRILTCIKFLVSQNLALRGHEENLNAENDKNVGNFLALIKLVAQYDPLLAKHVQHAEQNPGSVSYLSPEIQNEFIHILASTVKNKLLSDIRKNKYYGILLDSTPDLGHREQLSQVIRFVDVDFQTKKVTIKESFLGYIEIHSKDAASLEKVIVERLNSDEIPLADCRAQCYDNATVMSGHISGLQQRICDRNHRALFVNCDNHSLNLAGVHSAKQDPAVVTFFGTLESIYSFFSHSTIRWEELKRALPITVKRESETRWSARSEAVKAIHEGLDELVGLLEKLSEDSTMTPETRSGAEQLQACILNFNFIVLLQIWNVVLGKIDRVQKRLQDPTMNFKEAATDIESLEQEFIKLRDDLSQAAVENAKTKCTSWGIPVERRIRRRKRMPGELARDAGLSSEEEVVCVMKNVFDRLQQEMSTRFSRLKDLNTKFGFLLDVKTLLSDTDEDEIRRSCTDFANFYDTDINGYELFTEIGDCRMLLRKRTETLPETPLDLLGFIVFYGNDVFPNLRISLQILLTIAVSIASCERSFSKLKLILSYLRASMGQDRLSDLALLSVEREMSRRAFRPHKCI